MKPELIDVNVHPTKMELKFSNEQDVYSFTYKSVRETLLFKELIPDVAPGKEPQPETFRQRDVGKNPEAFENVRRSVPKDAAAPRQVVEVIDTTAGRAGGTPSENADKAYSYMQSVSERNPAALVAESRADYGAGKKYVQQDLFTEKFLTKEARAKHRLIGQLFKTYWLIEYDGRFFIMDQHAAHEKIKYEELMENYRNKKIYSQYLMPPAVVTLSAAEIEFLQDNMDMFETLGYQIESFGGREYKLTAVPDNLFGLDGRELFMDFIADACECKKTTIDVFIHRLSTMACKAALKGNTELSFKEADALIDQLLKLENPYTCPHGRPTVISMTETEIEKKFKRIQD